MSNFGANIVGTGCQLPEKRLTNDDLAKMVDTNDEWIVQRTGIRERRIIAAGESTATLATGAARKAIAAAGISPSEVELVVCATVTPEMMFPSTACFVAANLGLNGVPAFDMAAACSGFIYALNTGANFIKAGQYKNVVVIGAETLSRVIDYTDRSSCILFGDGAGSVVLQRTTEAGKGLIYSQLHATGEGWEAMQLHYPLGPDKNQFVTLKGREVYKFAVTKFEELIADAIKHCELSMDQVKLIVPHQVNQRIIDSAIERLGFPADRVYVNIDKYGNTSAASIPIALDEAWRAGRLQSGDVVIFVAFGAGLTWANAVVRV
ncbi:MAG TPA: beta-ketoacyl-ACP synthase III [Tepidisphaeraceae bacterium]|nr:beta-ketoacyl-ACP synthase III [Tepidisphaeraceae bacterium]